MWIRKALPKDAESIASLLLSAMEDIVYELIGEHDYEKALALMRYFAETENNQYSWQNCWVVESDGLIMGVVNVYNGAKLHQLRQPVMDYLKLTLNRHVSPEDETQDGEHYIDSLAVDPNHRCKGIATSLLKFLINEYVTKGGATLGLLVDESNVSAKRLYLRVGFKYCGRKTLLRKKLEHLQVTP